MRRQFLSITYTTAALFIFLFTTSPVSAQPDIMYQPVIGAGAGLQMPIELVTAPGDASGRMFIVEKPGVIRIWDGTSLLPTPFLDINSLVVDDPAGERGLLSMAFHPDYASNGFFFVYYNDNAGRITVARYQVSGNPNVAIATPNPATPLISIPKDFTNHNGGHLQFRTEGGINYLYFATGDGGNDPSPNPQDPNSLLGKMIRIDVDDAAFPHELWAWGLRNPFRWSFDRATGDIWIADVGQSTKEEINFLKDGVRGTNYGWPCFEGTTVYADPPANPRCDTVAAVEHAPILDYDNPALGSSVIGGYVYRGTEFQSMQGYYFATDFYSGRLWIIKPDGSGGWDITVRTGFATGVSSISETNDGSLYAVSLTGNTVYKLVTPIVTPLTLISFSGKPGIGYNELSWRTAFEQNIDAYVIEYSADGISYSPAGQVTSQNDAGQHDYSFRHLLSSSLSSPYYYRLKVTEFDGSFHYSPIIRVGNNNTPSLNVYPTTVQGSLVNIVSGQPVEKLVLISGNGIPVLTKNMNGTTGYFSLDLPSLPKGIYLLQVSGQGYQQIFKLFVP